jgi:hypothetical protein
MIAIDPKVVERVVKKVVVLISEEKRRSIGII